MSATELEKFRICYKCVNEPYLSSEIQKKNVKNQCHYCRVFENTITLGELAGYVNWSFKSYYEKVPFELAKYKKLLIEGEEIPHERGELATDVIEEITRVKTAIAIDLQKILFFRNYSDNQLGVEVEFNPKSRYINKTPNISELEKEWENFKFDLQSKSRFFSRSASKFLNMIFENLTELESFFQPELIVEAGPELEMNEFYRARCFEAKEDLTRAMEDPDIELGPPPPNSRVDGRMNPRGISVFYGSNNAEVALAEIRPPVGSFVLVGKFRLVRRVRLLNLDLREQKASHTVGSCFDPGFLGLLKRAIFLQKLATLLSRPVLPSVAELEYLPTQVISDYLTNELEPPFDGILFPSTQAASSGDGSELGTMANTNIVLFNRSSKVKEIIYPDKTKVRASYTSLREFGLHFFSVDVKSSNSNESVLRKDKDRPLRRSYPDKNNLVSFSNLRPNTLELDRESLSVHIVEGMVVKSDSYLVDWHEVSESSNNIEI